MARPSLLRVFIAGAAAATSSGADPCEGSACRAVELDGDAGSSMSLLQHRGRDVATTAAHRAATADPIDPQSQQERLDKARPFAWFHVPKAGSSLENFMIHLPGMCPGVPDDLVVSEETFGEFHNKGFRLAYDPLGANGSCPGSFTHWGSHDGADPLWDAIYNGHAVGMFRQPEQRIMSGYNYGQHSWPDFWPASNPLQYAEKLQGCAVRMLVHGGQAQQDTCGGRHTGMPTDADVKLAIERLRTGFQYVGLTDQWALSMCLGHRMFGGQCRLSDFVDGRVTDKLGQSKVKVATTAHLYDLSPLKGFKDPYDGALYQAALEIFDDECRRFNVSLESCQPCFEEAGIEMSADGEDAVF